MRVNSAFQTNASAAGGVRRAGTAGTFKLDGAADAAKANGTAATSNVGNIDSLIALQGVEEAGERKRRFARRGKNALDLLDELKAELLVADLRYATLGRLQGALDQLAERSGLPGLDSVLDEIGLRVAVEIAKRTPKAA